jgi:prophage DNA circulation protein
MTIVNIAKYPQAKFRDVEFHYQDSSVNGGRKTITHEFPDTNNRYVEDLGKLEKIYNVNALIDITTNNNNLTKFIEVLDKEGVGSLIHPIYKKQNVVVKNYSVNDTIRELGIVRVSIVFEKASRNRFPVEQEGNKGKITKFVDNLKEKADEKFGDNYKSVKGNLEKLNNATDSIKKTSREIKRATALVEGSANGFTAFVTSINEIIDNAGGLVQSPSKLASKLRTAFDNIEGAFDNALDIFNVTKNLTPFSAASEISPFGNSNTSVDIRANQALLNNYVSANALAISYEQASLIEYTDLDQLYSIKQTLEDAFNNLSNDLDREIYNSILDIRTATSNYLDSLLLSLPRIIEFNTQPNNLISIVYSFYGNLDNLETIRRLNKIKDTSRVSGTIKILSYGE